jgi:menaquinone-specific isochorismate synthase
MSSVTTEILGQLPDLSKLTHASGISGSWLRGGEGFIAFGIYRKTQVIGPKRFGDAAAWWRSQLGELDIQNNVHGLGTGPLLFTSFAFSELEPSSLVIPQIIVGRRGDKAWVTWIGDEHQPKFELANFVTTATLQPTFEQGSLSDENWQAQVGLAVEKIKRGEIEKVVLARDLLAKTAAPISAPALIAELEQQYPKTWVFYVDGLVGATPELLVRLNKSLVTSRVLAGTIRRTGDEAKDLALAASLAKSSKDLEEHEYAVRSVADALAPFCSSMNLPESPSVLHLANVMHLATDVTGVINDSASTSDIFKLMQALHPSAAVCGTPTALAREIISELEKMNRGRYAGPVGWIDSKGDGELGIALRCGQIESEQQIRIYAGCGIVAGSQPAEELAESQAKLLPMRNALTTL